MSEGEVEALKARLAGLGVQLGVAAVNSPGGGLLASASSTPRVVRKASEPAASRGRRSRSPAVRQRQSVDDGEVLAVAAKSPRKNRALKKTPGYDSDRSVDVAELLERCSRVEKILSSTSSAAVHAERAQTTARTARALSEPPAIRRRASPRTARRPGKAASLEATYVLPGPPRSAARKQQQQLELRAGRSPLASVLEQYREAETLWLQEKAKLRRELVEQRKRANKFEMEYKKLVTHHDSRSVDIKSLRAALKNRDSQIQQMTVRVRETEASLRRCNETAAEELACLAEERDDLKSLLQATLQRLESVDEVLHRADVSTAMMEEKIKALDLERLKAVNRAAVARAEADTLAKNHTKLQWQTKMLERLSDHITAGTERQQPSSSKRPVEPDSDDSDDS